MTREVIHLLDYGAGNVRSVRNAIRKVGFEVVDIKDPNDIDAAEKIVFPGVGNYGNAMKVLNEGGFTEPLKRYLEADRPFFGICVGMQTLFEGSSECPEVPGLGVIKGSVTQFSGIEPLSVPHIGWNGIKAWKDSALLTHLSSDLSDKLYFVHSFCAMETPENKDWILTTTDYGVEFISSVHKGNVMATQFHPEKSGGVGLSLLRAFCETPRGSLERAGGGACVPPRTMEAARAAPATQLARRIIACLDVRTNDEGDLVVTKGDGYNVREAPSGEDEAAAAAGGEGGDGGKVKGKGRVRNLGKPVDLCARYYEEGADEVTFLNITSFRPGQAPADDAPMLAVLQAASERVFVPLCVGGGIRDYQDASGRVVRALEMAGLYFRAGADKISIGSDAVYAAEEYLKTRKLTGQSSLEQISKVYGRQAVVVSMDPRRVYVGGLDDPAANGHAVVRLEKDKRGPDGQEFCWYQATVCGGRETRDVDMVQLATASEALGAGELLVNSVDMDGQGKGFDTALLEQVKGCVGIPVIASSGAGGVEHFRAVFEHTPVESALAAGIFHRKEVAICDVKQHLQDCNLPARLVPVATAAGAAGGGGVIDPSLQPM